MLFPAEKRFPPAPAGCPCGGREKIVTPPRHKTKGQPPIERWANHLGGAYRGRFDLGIAGRSASAEPCKGEEGGGEELKVVSLACGAVPSTETRRQRGAADSGWRFGVAWATALPKTEESPKPNSNGAGNEATLVAQALLAKTFLLVKALLSSVNIDWPPASALQQWQASRGGSLGRPLR